MRTFRHTFFNKLFQVSNRFLFKIKGAKTQFLESACSFYLGFIIGNLFGTFLDLLRNKIIWDGIILITIIFFFEFLNFIIYNKKQARRWSAKPPTNAFADSTFEDFGVGFAKRTSQRQTSIKAQGPSSKFQNKKRFIIFKNLQIGILFGLFLDAFKVGS